MRCVRACCLRVGTLCARACFLCVVRCVRAHACRLCGVLCVCVCVRVCVACVGTLYV